ncbi:hypothetical protein HPB49_013920 [Dermacentor silvarum]|uniref:Uncharacterized protein n=1 Tax=Dermacentor silvarum TaxID=543639 RepID=A0ACB8C3Y1_DERSI|nr:hypothetical protein HPB49_013920 [Dermacentor silvarum]
MQQLRAKRGFVRRAITKAISTIGALLPDEVTPLRVLHLHLELILAKQAELVEFDRAIQETLTDADLEADLTTDFQYEQKVSFTKTSARLATELHPPFLPFVQRASESESIDTPPRATSVSTSGTGLMPVFLQTGRAWAVRPARSILLRFLLDMGSQRTFVRQDISRALNRPVQGVEHLTLSTFGKTQRPVTLTCNRVSFTLRSQHSTNELTIDAL